jgi:L-alanine-DL-glutamate epimerase-like enolase superfamily enzyme
MCLPTDVRPVAASLYLLPIRTRMPLKFGPEITTEVTCARVKLTVADRAGRTAEGWGETPLSVQWVWPSSLSYRERHDVLVAFCKDMVELWGTDLSFALDPGHPMEIGHAVLEHLLEPRRRRFNHLHREGQEEMPHLAALVCLSAFDLALHDAYGVLHGVPTYDTYNASWMNFDLAHYLDTARDATMGFQGHYPADFLVKQRPDAIRAWHLVGGKDPVSPDELTGEEPDDGHPVLLRDWVRRDGLKCLKVKLTGTDPAWDYRRLLDVGAVAVEEGCDWLTADFNCTVEDPDYVTDILDRLMIEQPRLSGMVLYVEQPFPYDLAEHPIIVNAVSARKPLFLDESAHDWRVVRLGRSLGWTGVALKTCKTQTGALLSQAWAKAHGMTLMVQDLTNPMLAQLSHLQLGAHAGTIMGVETNGMQFYPEASRPEAAVHPGAYQRRDGLVRLDTIRGPGLGYRIDEVHRDLPAPAAEARA